MYQLLRTYLWRIVHAFSTRMRIAVVVFTVFFAGWFVSQFVLAQKEANVYVFPAAVTTDGWNNETNSLGQDLSPEAELADFDISNSSYLRFGTYAVSATATPATTTDATRSSGDGAPDTSTSLPTSLQSGGEIISTVNNSVTTASDTSRASSSVTLPPPTPATTPATLETPDIIIPALPSPFIPSIDLTPPAPTSPQSFGERIKQFAKFIVGATTVLADDLHSTSSDAISTSSATLPASGSVSTDTATFPVTPLEQGTNPGSNQGSISPQVTPMSNDPYTIASCTTLGLACHLMSYVGFGLGDALVDKPITGATLELSLAGRADSAGSATDRILVRAYHAGRWIYLGDTGVKGEFSNAQRGGYLSFDLSAVGAWSDLTDLKVVVEYVRESGENSSVYVDGVWVNVRYESDGISGSTPEELALSAQNVRSALSAKDAQDRKVRRDLLTTPEGTQVSFAHVDTHPDAKITVKSDKELYHAFGSAQSYVNVTNDSAQEEVVRLQFHFPEGGAQVKDLVRYSRNVPYKVGRLKYDSVGYFCANGWQGGGASGTFSATSTDAQGKYQCLETGEVQSCDSLNDDKTNCIQAGAKVGLTEDTEFRSGWSPLSLQDGSFRDEGGLFAKAMDFILGQLPKNAIPDSQSATSYIGDSILLLPGQTAYVRADLTVPANGRGDFYIEAVAESGAYGLLKSSWDGSWNYRIPVSVAMLESIDSKTFSAPISLEALPKTFWDRVNVNGSDIRFVDGTGERELPYWLASFDHALHKGLVWVRVPYDGQSSSSLIYLYYGDKDADPVSDPAAPFRTEELTARAVIVGGTQRDMSLSVIASAEGVKVRAGEHNDVSLKRGESALFDNLTPGTMVFADGPVTLSLETVGGDALLVPFGYAGTHFVAPALPGGHTLSLIAMTDDVSHAEVRSSANDSQSLDPLFGTVLSTPVELTNSHRIDATTGILSIIGPDTLSSEASVLAHAPSAALYPATDETLYGFAVGKVTAGYGEDASTLSLSCSGGGREEVDGRREGMSTNFIHCQEGVPELADAMRVSALSHPVSVMVHADTHLSSFIPESEWSASYVLPEDAKSISLLCAPLDGTPEIGVFDPEGVKQGSAVCEPRGVRPGKAMLTASSSFTLGSIVRSIGTSTLFMAGVESAGAALGGTTHPFNILHGNTLLRAYAPNHPDVTHGDEEFVVPGEHRLLDLDQSGNEKKHVDKLLTTQREFSIRQKPGFTFKYTPQSNSLAQGIRAAFGVDQFAITKITLKHPLFGELPAEYDVTYGQNDEWSLTLNNTKAHLHPGKYTLHVEIEEGGATYVDEFDFYWGVLAINENKSVFTPGEDADISIGALSDNGNTICDASLKLWITQPESAAASSSETEVPVKASGLCNGNNVVDVPDYSATYHFDPNIATGTYQVKLVRLDRDGNIASQITDTIRVVPKVPIIIERVGPTRIYPVAHYPMKIKVTAVDDFKGNITERLPGDFVFIDRGNADLQWGDEEHSFITATWAVDMKKGAVLNFSYIFDAPDRSPYLYELGPIKADGNFTFEELRKWQIASDAAGKMMVFYDDDTQIPVGWSCLSCTQAGIMYQRFAFGSTTAGGTSGTATHTPTALATVNATTTAGVGPNTTTNTINTPIAHSHTLTPQVSGVSNLPRYRSLRVLQYNSAGEPSSFPTSTIVLFDVASSSLPSGWLRYSAEDGYYPYMASTSGTIGGSNTHSHTATGTTSAPPETGLRSSGGAGVSAVVAHTHFLSTTTSDVLNNEPPYREMLMARLAAPTTTMSNYMITMWDNTPPAGWTNLSDPGGPLSGKFIKASTTYGTTGGSLTHTHADITNATTTTAIEAGSNYQTSASNAQAPQNHFHDVSITGFSVDSHTPPYFEVIFAKRLSGIVQWTQKDFSWYANQNVITPTDPWPVGSADLTEDAVIDANTTLVKPTDILRLRMNVGIANATATPLIKAFKLQYVAATDCTSALNWSDVGAIGAGSAVWRGYNNTSVTDGATLPSTILSLSNTAQSYVEANNSPGVVATTTMGQYAEWDWVIQDNLATSSTNYCFRMVLSDGTPLDTYTNYPQATTNSQPNQATLETVPFNNEKVGTTTPNFNFIATDPEADDLDYQIQIDTNASFTAPVIDKDSTVNPELFDNLDKPSNKAPFTSGQNIHYQATALTNGNTYWWRVRAKDTGGSNTWGSWSTAYSFTVDTTVTISTWHQTSSAQFQTGSFSTANSSTSDAVWVDIGSTVGTVWGPEVDFSVKATGTVWGSYKVASTTSSGTVKARLEYFTSTSSWNLIPDSDLSGNSAGFTASSTSLLGIDPSTYAAIRPRVDFTTGGGAPKVLDWTIDWSNKVNAPALSSPFDNQKVATRTPTFIFASSDPYSADLQYEISWSTSSAFTSSTTVNSATTSSGWLDVTNNADTNPYRSGDTISYTPPGVYQLASSTTYYWRVRARDVNASNVNSFWSSVYSLYVDTTVTVSTWFQTADGQWNSDTLTGLQTFSTDTLRVATSTSEALIGYGEGVQQTPKYRIWNGSSWSAQSSALTILAPINWVVTKASPVTGEYLMGTIGTNNDANVQVYNGSTWGNKQLISGTLSNAKARGLDMAYETITGRAIAVSCNGGVNPVYRIWTSTTSSWSASQSITVNGNNNCSWIRLASNPLSNEIAMVERDTGSRYQALIWDGSSWKSGAGSTTLGSITSTSNEGMAIAYNASGTRAFVTTSNGANSNFIWTYWNGSVWAANTTNATTRRIQWIDLDGDPNNTNNMIACYTDLTAPDIGVSRWTGAAWSANVNLTTIGNSPNGKGMSCVFENTSGRSGNIMVPFSDTAGSQYSIWTGAAWSAQATVSNIGRAWTVDAKRASDGTILSMFFEHLTSKYQFSSWNGSSWSASTTLESSPSVTASPYLQPFMVAPKLPATAGTVYSSAINFADGAAPGWDKVLWSASSTASSSLAVQVQYYDSASTTWKLIPDAVISGNSGGTTTSPINIRSMDTALYAKIRLVGNATCYLGTCPLLYDWTATWAAGLNISGTAKQHDLTTNVTSGTVAVAVNGVLQAGKTGTIANGAWSISNVTFFSSSTIEVFVQGAATSARAVSVMNYSGPGDITGMSLNEHWITIGSASSTNTGVTLTNLSKYDNSVSSSTDTFYDVDDTTGNFNNCAIAVTVGCYDAGLYVLSGNVFQPSTSSAKTLSTYDIRITGGVYNDANTLKVAGAWRNLGGFTPGAGTVILNATSGVNSIDSTGAATSTFFNLTFGEAATQATWSFASALTATGTLSMNFGTTSPGAQLLTIQGNLAIGASGTFQKGTATTTFSGTVSKTWTDLTAAKQDLGNISASGTAKTITLGSSVKATSIQIISGDTVNAGGANTLTVGGNWDNNGTFSAQTGTVTFATSSTGMTINQGTSNFYNTSFNAATGSWRWLNTNATTSNDFTIATGTVTLPGGTFEVGGSFQNTGGTFAHNSGVVKLTSTAGGKNIQVNNSPFNDLTFNGSGGTWSFTDTNATTSGTFTILLGTPSLPSGILEVGNNFNNASASFNSNNGTLKMTSALTSRTITLGGLSLGNLLVQNAGIFSITDTNATTTGNVTFNAGTTTLPTANFAIGGSLTNTGVFTPGSDLVTFFATSGSRTISSGSSSFASVNMNGVGGNFTILSNATSTSAFTLTNVNAFTLTSGKTLAVGGTFTNLVGGASTTWSGSTLALNSATNYTVNTKTLGGDIYATFREAPNTQIRMWNSSTTVNAIDPTSSLYSQNHNAVVGELDIFGAYVLGSGTDYWDYAKDFDGTALGSPRQANVRFDTGASASFTSGTTLEIVGTSTASTSIDRKAGNYGITLASSTINAQYYQFRNMNATGLYLSASTTVTSLANGDFSLDTNGGTTMTVASSTIDTNPGLQIFNVKFATSTGISAGFNVSETGVPASFWRFKLHYGNYAGEAYDNDPGPSSGNPGYIKWDDSNFTISIAGKVYADAGVTILGAPTCDGVTNVVRVKVAGVGNFAAPCSATSSYYQVNGVSFNGDTVMTTYLDTAGGAQGAVVTKSASADLTGINIYQHRVIVRHEDVTAMTIADMKAYDKSGDTDVPFTVSTSSVPFTLTTDPDTEFWVWTGKTFIPGGNLILNSGGSGAAYDGKFHIDNSAVFTAGNTEVHSVGGGVSIDAGATFTVASSSFVFTATTSGKIITGIAPLTFNRMTWAGIGGGWTIAQNTTVNENFLTNAGTVSGTANVTVVGTSTQGAGKIAMTGGTFTLANGGTFGSNNSDWQFNNLNLGQGGAVATSTKTGSSTVNMLGILTDTANQVFQAGTSTTWLLSGGGTPLVLSGTFDSQNSIFRYAAATGAVTATAAAYFGLDFGAASSSSAPTYTLAAGTFTVVSSLNIGTSTGSLVTVNANTNDPTFTASGNVFIKASSTFTLSDTSAFTARRSWQNQGTTTPSGGTVTFDATTTGWTIDSGRSAFANVLFNNVLGGWTITANATTSGTFNLASAGSFTMASGTTLEVDGAFTNLVGGASTTWATSTLYLNSAASSTINTKTTGADIYATLLIGANTQPRMWNSSSSVVTLASTGSLYSMNHGNVSGALNIYGAYAHSIGTDYWDYATDFDGASLGGSPRVANIRIATSSTLSFTAGGLDVTGGASGGTTTIDVQNSGAYGLSVSGGTLSMQYYNIRNTDPNGLSISGSPAVTTLSNGDFLLGVNGGSMMTVAGGTIDANPLLTFFGNRFATSSSITSGYNVTATGVSASLWTFSGLNGNYAGEAFDNDPGGDPGYIRWDDSAAQITVSGNVYTDEGFTPMGGPVCNGATQNVILKVQGAGNYTSACNGATGAFSISNILYNPKDTLTLFLASSSNATAVNIAYDPVTNISNMHLYQNRVIVRHEQGTAVGIGEMAKFDAARDSSIPFTATTTGATTTTMKSNTGLVVWTSKTFAPGGTVILAANASVNSWDGSVHLLASSTWSGASTNAYTIGGQFLSENAASVSPANTTFTFNATTSGKTITASTSLTFYNLAFSGVAGRWTTPGLGTVTNDFSIATGTVTLPPTTLAVGGSFLNTNGTFDANRSTVQFTSTAAGKSITVASSSFNALSFTGAGGAWAFTNTNASTTATTTITAGTVTLPSGIFAVGTSLNNQTGTLTANGGTVKLTSTSTGNTILLSGSSLANLLVAATGTYAFIDSNATLTGDMTILYGTTTFPYASLTVGGSFVNSGFFTAGTSTLTMNSSAAGKSITTGSSSLNNLTISGASGGFTVTGNATTTGNFTLTAANTFTQTSGKTFAVGGTFTNSIGGAPTTWTGSVLSLYSPTSYSINTKATGGDAYDTIRLASTSIRMWSSSVATTQLTASSSIYSQNNAGTSGQLYIYGNYTRMTGTDYWSYATDFDGTALGGSSRQTNVRFDAGATASFSSGATLQMLGSASASTTIDRISAGNYGVTLDNTYLNASYYQFRNMNSTGLSLSGTTTITSMNNGDFSLDVIGGSSITIASSSVNQNASAQIFTVKFATSSGITSGSNVTLTGTTGSAITFNQEYGNYAGEAFDTDGATACGSIRWTDSACLISDQRGFRWRYDDGAEGVPATEWYNQSWTKRERVRITNTSTSTITNAQVKMTVPYDSDMQANFQDLRFTDSSGTTSIPFWVEASTSVTSAIVWVKIPSLPASSFADVFMYFGNPTATAASDGLSTFKFFDDFEDNNITEYSGDTTLFANSTSFNYERGYGIGASAGNTSAQNVSGIGQTGAGVGQDTTFRFFQYIDMSSGAGDEPCFLFGIQAPMTAHQNYAVCLSPFGADHLVIAKNAKWNGRNASDGATLLSTKAVTYTTGWYEVSVDWLTTNNQINVNVYDNTGTFFASTSAMDSTYTSGGVGFTFWGQHGGWDIPAARAYNYLTPTVAFGIKQADSGATWAAIENSYLPNYPANQNVRLRFSVRNSSLATLNVNFRLQYAAKTGFPNCESVTSGNFVDVPVNASCGGNAACMSTSAQFAKASSTQLLSIPTGFIFTQGQILEDPNNQTDVVSVAASQFTEVEYNFQMNANANQDRYCFRTTNAGAALDNYSRVAEIQVVHPPVISGLSFNSNSNIALTEGASTTIYATGTVSDLNGYTDLVNASSTYYRSSVAGGNSCASNNNNCYQIATTSCSFSNCGGNSCTFSCSANLYYFADPTDVGSFYAADVWNALVDIWDTSNSHATSSANQDIYTLSAITTTSTIPYGSITVGTDSGARNATTTVGNTGNSTLNLNLGGDDLTAGASRITYDKQKYATSTFTYSGCAICSLLAASTSPTYVPLGVSKATTTIFLPTKDIYWGIGIPSGTAATTFSGSNIFGATP